MANFTPKVTIEFNSDEAATDVTGDVLVGPGLRCQRGKDQIRIQSPPMAGSAQCRLDNRSGNYNPDNTASPYAGELLPGKRIRFLNSADPAADSAFVRTVTLGTLRNNFTGCVGFRLNPGTFPIVVTALGRWKVAGNSRVHTLRMMDSFGNTLATVDVDMSTGVAGQFVYGQIPPITMGGLGIAGQYYFFSSELAGGDQFYDGDCVVTLEDPNPLIDADIVAAAFENTCGIDITEIGSFFQTYGPLNFKTERGLWAGLVDDWQNDQFQPRSASVPALGFLSWLAGKKITTSVFQNIRTDTAIQYILMYARWGGDNLTVPGIPGGWNGNAILAAGEVTMRLFWLDNEDALAALIKVLNTEGPGASIYEGPNGEFVFENRSYRFSSDRSDVTVQDQFTDTEIADLRPSNNFKDVVNVATAVTKDRALSSLGVVWSYGSSLVLAAGETRRIIARTSSGDPFGEALCDPTGGNEVQTITGSLSTDGMVAFSFLGEDTGVVSEAAGEQGIFLPYNSSAATIQGALRALSGIGATGVSCSGGPLGASPVVVTFQGSLANKPLKLLGIAISKGSLFTDNSNTSYLVPVPGSPTSGTVTVVETTVGANADYVVSAGSATVVLSDYAGHVYPQSLSGASVFLDITAGGSGATIDGLQVRGKVWAVQQTNEITNSIDTTDSQAKYGLQQKTLDIRAEISRDDAQTLCDGMVSLYREPKKSLIFQLWGTNANFSATDFLHREISDLISIVSSKASINSGFWIDQITHEVRESVISTTFGCERVTLNPWPTGRKRFTEIADGEDRRITEAGERRLWE